MPSSSIPGSTVAPGPGPVISGSGGAGNNTALLAHISDPADAHPATAIGYAGGPVWADLSTNPAATVEFQLDKIVTDLGGTAGEAKIGTSAYSIGSVSLSAGTVLGRLQALVLASNHHYVSGPTWADLTTNPVNTVEGQLDKIVTDLSATTGSAGVDKIGAREIVVAPSLITIAAGTLRSQLECAFQSRGHILDAGPAWRDSTTNLADTAQDFVHKLISDLTAGPAGVGFSGASKVGVSQRSAWLGGRSNPGNISVLEALDKIIVDLGVASVADDGSERIGAAARGSDLDAGSVASQLTDLSARWGKLERANLWTNTNTVEGPVGDTNPIFVTDNLPTVRKLVWRIRAQTTPTVIYTRLYFELSTNAMILTHNAGWNGTAWAADDTAEAATSVLWAGGQTTHRAKDGAETGSPWLESAWSYSSFLSTVNLALGTNAPTGISANITARNGVINFQFAQSAIGSDTNPPATQGHINQLKAKNTPKIWGSVQTGLSLSILDGFNLASVSYAGQDLIVNIQSDFANANYAVNCTLQGPSGFPGVAMVVAKSAGSFTVRVYDMAGVQVDITSLLPAYRIDFVGFGVQN